MAKKTSKSSTKKASKLNELRITEKQRTVILLILLALSVGLLYYVQNNVETNFVDQL